MKKYIFMLQVFSAASLIVVGQYIGIGTPAPTEKLDVAGNIKAATLKPNAIKFTGAANDFFGNSVSISGNYAIVGAYADDGVAGADQGSASIYQWNGSNWVLMQKLTDASGAADDLFGINVSISGNYAIVGAYADDGALGADQGSASIYLRMGLGCQRLQYITDPGANANDNFGKATAIDGATHRFLIGANTYANNSGKVVFGKIN